MKQKHLLEFSCDLRFVIHQTVDVLLECLWENKGI